MKHLLTYGLTRQTMTRQTISTVKGLWGQTHWVETGNPWHKTGLLPE
jgi:hypothetical protein